MVKEGGVYEQQKSQDQSNGHGGSRSNGSGTLPGNSILEPSPLEQHREQLQPSQRV